MEGPYHLIAIIAGILALYFLTLLGAKFAVINKIAHRRIWNSMLLFTFLITAALGLVLALQVNYRFEIPHLDTYMLFHVDFGIAMAIVSIIHLVWHWNYYVKIFKPSDSADRNMTESPATSKQMQFFDLGTALISLFFLGFHSLVVQTIYMREFLALFTGNELIIGIIMALWMIFVGLGSFTAKRKVVSRNTMRLILLILVLLPLLSFAGMNLLRYKFFVPGMEVNLLQTAIYITIFQLPFCIVSGFLFPQLVMHIQKKKKQGAIGFSYGIETLGSVLAGAVLGFLLFTFTTNLNILIISFILGALLIVFQFIKLYEKVIFSLFVLVVSLVFITFPVDKQLKESLFINQEILKLENSVYGEVVKTSHFEQVNIYENQNLVYSSGMEQKTEEAVHFTLIQHDKPETVLIISPNIAQVMSELSMYPTLKTVDFLETNQVLIEHQNQLLPDTVNFNYRIHQKDAIQYLTHNKLQYDAIIIQTPPPSTLNYNRYYTRNFYRLVMENLHPSGLMSASLPASMNYVNPALINLTGSIYYTIKQVFKEVLILPGTSLFLLASNARLSNEIITLLESVNIEADYVNPYYLDAFSMHQQQEQILAEIKDIDLLNSLNNPNAFLYNVESWYSKTGEFNRFIPYLLAVLLIIVVATVRNLFLVSVFISGFTVTSIELLVILMFQMIIGSVYQYISVIIALFMIGMAMGSFWQQNRKRGSNIHPLQIIIAVILALISIVAKFFLSYQIWHVAVFVLLGMLISVLCGRIFVISANSIGSINSGASKAYGFDLMGAALGAFAVPVIVVPFFGLIETILIITALNLGMGIYMTIRKL